MRGGIPAELALVAGGATPRSSRTTTAPIGTSPCAAHALARSIARPIHAASVGIDLPQPIVADAEVVRDLVGDGAHHLGADLFLVGAGHPRRSRPGRA